MKILLIEDDRRSAPHTLETLQQRGHSVQLAEDERAGLKLAVSQDFWPSPAASSTSSPC